MTAGVGWDTAAEVTGWAGLPPLVADRTADACVVGLGGTGLAAVRALADRGLSVVGIDAGRVAAGAAGRNGGFLVAGPEPALHHAVDRWGPCAVELYRATLAEIDDLAGTLPPGTVRRTGSIRLAGLPGEPADELEVADRAREVADCEQQLRALRDHNIPAERYDGPLGRGLYLPRDAALNPAVRAIVLATQLRGRAHLHEHTRVTQVEPGLVRTRQATVHAPVIVVAVDGRLDRLLPQLRGRVRTARLQMLATEPVPDVLPCPVYGRWGYDYAQQLPDGRLFVGGGRDRFAETEWTDDAEPTAPVQDYVETVARRMAGRPVTVTHRWAASVGYTADERALCVRVADGVVAVGGYSGTGNLVGPVAARAAVSWLLDGVEPPPYLAS